MGNAALGPGILQLHAVGDFQIPVLAALIAARTTQNRPHLHVPRTMGKTAGAGAFSLLLTVSGQH